VSSLYCSLPLSPANSWIRSFRDFHHHALQRKKVKTDPQMLASPKHDDSALAADVVVVVVVGPSTVAAATTDTCNQGSAAVLLAWAWTVFLNRSKSDQTSSSPGVAAVEPVVAAKSTLSSPPCSSEPWTVSVERPSRQWLQPQ